MPLRDEVQFRARRESRRNVVIEIDEKDGKSREADASVVKLTDATEGEISPSEVVIGANTSSYLFLLGVVLELGIVKERHGTFARPRRAGVHPHVAWRARKTDSLGLLYVRCRSVRFLDAQRL